MMPWIARRLWQFVVAWHESLVFFTYDPRQGDGVLHDQVTVVGRATGVPPDVRAWFLDVRGRWLWTTTWLRIRLQGATLLVLRVDGEPVGYLWFRRCDPFPRRYRWLTPRGTLLGYVWVAPPFRRRGIAERLNRAAIALSGDRRRMPLIVYADTWNAESRRLLEKSGFARLGTYEVSSRALGLWCTHRPIEEEATIEGVWSGSVE